LNLEPEKNTLLSYKLLAQLDEISKLAKAVESALHCYPELIYAVNLCLDELITNIILYGFKDFEGGEIEIKIYLKDGFLEILIEDKAPAFNPFLSVPEPNINASLKDRAIGGLGVYFVRRLMDNFRYNHNEHGNQISIYKKIC